MKEATLVKRVSEHQSLSPAVNNDSTALFLQLKVFQALRESCQGNSEWNKFTVSCQGVERCSQDQDRRTEPEVKSDISDVLWHLQTLMVVSEAFGLFAGKRVENKVVFLGPQFPICCFDKYFLLASCLSSVCCQLCDYFYIPSCY